MNDEKVDRYLFDPTAPPADEVKEIEDLLAPLRYDAEKRPLRRAQRRYFLAAAAAALMFLAGGAVWMWSWPAERPWRVTRGPIDTIPIGRTVQSGRDSLMVRVARIGWMQIDRNSVLTLRSTRSNKHRLEMTEGSIRVSVWAPPASFGVTTPEGEVLDVGCAFDLHVEKGVSRVDVISGWVQMENGSGEVLVPGGATSEMTRARRPSVPVFRSAAPEFRVAVRALERDPSVNPETLLRTARKRDVLTLLLLAERGIQREKLLTRAAELAPPRSPETLPRARRGDSDAIWEWKDELPLPPAKSWLRNWRDRLFLR